MMAGRNAEVVVANHALVMAAMESEAVLPDPKNLLLVLDEGHHRQRRMWRGMRWR